MTDKAADRAMAIAAARAMAAGLKDLREGVCSMAEAVDRATFEVSKLTFTWAVERASDEVDLWIWDMEAMGQLRPFDP